MNHDDPRHGTTRGYHAGCREKCCLKARSRYEKEGRLARLNGGRAVPALGYQRRIQALMRLGWTSQAIADAGGWSNRNHVLRVLKGQKGKPTRYLQRPTAERIEAVYERLSMRLPEPSPTVNRCVRLAERNGWPPPLAWDDIDDPNEQPRGVGGVSDDDRVEHLADLVRRGCDLADAMRELRIGRETLRRWCSRHGHMDLYAALARREKRTA